MKNNIITKQLDAPQEQLLRANGIAFDCVPVLDFKMVFDKEKAENLLATPDAVWVFTSVRAVVALNDLLKAKTATPAKIFTVGQNAADELGKLRYQVDFIGHVSEDLLDVLALQKDRPILYFRGRHYRSSIPDFCAVHGLDFRSLECYYSVKLQPAVELGDYGSIWVFSPLSAHAVSEWKGVSMEKPVYAIGLVTADYLKKLGFKNIISPEVPSFENMVNLYLWMVAFEMNKNLPICTVPREAGL